MVTGKERVLCAFSHKKADRLPAFDVVNKPDMYTELLGESNYESGGRLCVRLAKKLGMDAVTVHSAPYTCLIADAIRQVVDTAGGDGGLIIATDHSFHEGIPTENVLYFLEKAKELGKLD